MRFNRFGRFLTLLFLCAFFSTAAAALSVGTSPDQMVMDQWDDRTGLPSNNVLDVLQDRRGYVWLASYDGLVRFDGKTFAVITKENLNGFTSNSARVLAEAPDGTLWIGTNTSGLFSYSNGKFTGYGLADGLPDLSIRALGFDRFGTLWVGTSGGLAVRKDKGFASLGDAGGIVTFLQPLDDGSLLAGMNTNGLYRTGPEGITPWVPAGLDPETAAVLSSRSFTSSLIDNSGRLWLGTASGTILVFRGNALVSRFDLPELKGATVKDFLPDRDGTLWIATDKGLAYGGLSGFGFYTEAEGLPNNSVTSLWLDREGSLWAGTDRGGIVKFSPGKFLNLTVRDGLKGNAVNTVVEDSYGSLWVGTDQGLSVLFSDTDPAGADSSAPNSARRKAVERVLSDIGGARIRQIRLDSRGALWFSTYSNQGLYVFDGTSSRSVSQERGLQVSRFRLSLEDSRGRVWAGTSAGLCLVDEGKIFTRAEGLKNEFILGLSEDRQGRLWIGLDGGGAARMEADGSFTSWTTEDGLAGNVVFRVFEDSAGRIWACTSDGLSLIDPAGGVRNFRTTDGMLSDTVYEILQEGASGNLWVITSRGVAVLDPAELAALKPGEKIDKKRVRVFNRLDGLAGQPAANSWAFINSAGVFYFPTIGGLSVYNPQSVVLNPTPPPVYVEEVVIDGQPVDIPSDGSPVRVPAGTKRVSIGYTALSFMIPQKVGFRYMMEGYDRESLNASGERFAVYTNLPPGGYRFRVVAWNNDGVVNETGAAVSFRVLPRFYQRPFFILFLLVFLPGLGYLVNLARLRVETRRRNHLERLVADRTADLVRERERSETLLLNVLPSHVAAELKSSGRAESRVHNGVTVFVADIVGFTEKSSRLSPDQTIGELNAVFGAFDRIMDAHGCERIKTVGDAYIAVARLAPCQECSTVEEDAHRIAEAALECVAWLESYRSGASMPWEVRCGMNTGPVVGGVVGTKKYIFDIFGDTVNIAFRMQGESLPGDITLSSETAALLKGRFVLENRGPAELKGKGSMERWTLRGRA